MGRGMGRYRPFWTPSALFSNGEVGGWYETHPDYCFTDTAGTTKAGIGDAVARREDRSGSGRHQTQATAANRPILRQEASGEYYLEYDGVDDALTASPYVADAATVLGMALSTTDLETIIQGEAGDTGTFLFAAKDADASTTIYSTRGTAPTSFRANGTAQTPADRDAAQVILAANQVFLWEGHTWGLAAAGGDALWLGYAATSFRYSGKDYGGVEVFNRTLTSDERSRLETYLAGLAGVTL